jgi:hypothetical protein
MSNLAIVSILTIVGVSALVAEIWALRQVNWQRRLTSPLVVSAVVAGGTTFAVAAIGAVGSVVSSWISASSQRATDIEKSKANVVLSVVQQYDSSLAIGRNESNRRERIRILIQSGVIPDENGSICKAVMDKDEGCPIEVLKAK